MTDIPRLSIRRWAQLALCATVVLSGAFGFPGVPGTSTNYVVAQGGCDADCWAILSYLADQGLTQEDIIALGNSGLEPDPDTPIIEPGNNGGYVIVEPPPVSNQGNQGNQGKAPN